MVICWDNLEKLRYNKNTDRWYRKTKKKSYIYKEIFSYREKCEKCGEPFLSKIGNKGEYCSRNCSKKDKTLTVLHRGKLSDSLKGEKCYWYGKNHSKETRRKISKSKTGKTSIYWKNGYCQKNIPLYDTYAPQIEWCEEVKRNNKDPNILEVKCTWCGKWFVLTRREVCNRIQALKGSQKGENRFYCSNGCKQNCPIYNKSPEQLIKEDAVKSGRLPWLELGREVQPELRKMVLKRDNWECQKCGGTEGLHCHHILPVSTNPLESADMDNSKPD